VGRRHDGFSDSMVRTSLGLSWSAQGVLRICAAFACARHFKINRNESQS
jgi:hypothetical protein